MQHSSWHALIKEQLPEGYFGKINHFMEQVYAHGTVYPPKEKVFQALLTTPLEEVKVVILGQDPYHNVGQAQGLSFSVQKGIALPPSLQNIFKELQDDLSYPIPKSGDLSHWAEQGVLLLNTVLTVRAHQAFSHRGIGWEEFTDATIRAIEEKEEPVVYILWGSPAQKKRAMIHQKKRLILTAPHPSPLSAYRGFFGSRPFSKCNAYLEQEGLSPIDWRLSDE